MSSVVNEVADLIVARNDEILIWKVPEQKKIQNSDYDLVGWVIYDEFLRLLTHNKLSNITTLDLSNIHLNSLPLGITNLRRLSVLDLARNKLSKFPIEIIEFKNLNSLNMAGNKLSDLPNAIGKLENLRDLDLSSNRLSSLPPEIGQLKNLEELHIRGNILKSLPHEICQLQNLSNLALGHNRFESLPSEIWELRSLKILTIPANMLKTFPNGVLALKRLEILRLGGNRFISSVPSEIHQLRNLKELDTSHNNISKLPPEILDLKELQILDIRGNPLPIPPEILEKINDPTLILEYYFKTQIEVRRPLYEAKVAFIGQGFVGKTSLIKRILHQKHNPDETKTEGISIEHWHVQNQSESENKRLKIQLNIWDFGGQEIMHATHQFFLTKRSLYLLVLDSRLTQEENRVEYWLKIIQSFGGESPVLIVGNKIDQHPLDIDRTGLQKKYPNIVGILETSAATGAGIEELKAAITDQVNNLPHVRDLLPETWFTVKTKLEELGRQSNFITHDKYLELCAENEVTDEISQRTLIAFLHDLGVVLHFQDDPRLEALGILNPQWVTNGVYKILNSHTLFQNKGVLTVSMLDEILNLPEYPRGKRLFIIDMMKKFELCYDIETDKTFLVPDLLPKDEPAELKFNGIPAFEYAYPVLPSSVITRFIVRMNQHIDDNCVWRTGVVLKIGENKALVKADIEDRKITIAIDGLEHTRRDALSAIRYQLDEIHESIKGLNPNKRVPIPEALNAEPLDYDYLLQLERDGELEILPIKDGSRLVKVNIRKLLSGVVSEAERKKSAGNTTNIYIEGDVKDSNLIAGDENDVSSK
jgi:internalin A